MKNNFRRKDLFTNAGKWGAILVTAASVSACGGGSSSGSSNNPPSTPSETEVLTGRVADGYIEGATVCLDLNDNKLCDENEPSAVSGPDGKFAIEGVSIAQQKAYSLIADVPGTAIDQDNPGQAIGARYVMSGVKGNHSFVSPLTTMIQTQLETNPGLTPKEVAEALASQLGLNADVDLMDDYVEKKNSDERYKKAHSVAQVVAAVMAKNYDKVTDRAETINDKNNSAALQRIVVNQALNNLEGIVFAVEEAELRNEAVDPKKVTEDETFSVDTANLQDAIKRDEINTKQTTAPVRTILEDGFNEFQVESVEPGEYEHLRMYLDSSNTSSVIHRFSEYEDGGWSPMEDEGGETHIRWIDGEWKQVERHKDLPVSFMDDGRARLTFTPGDSIIIRGSWIDLEDKSVEDILEESSYEGVPGLGTVRFTSGAKGVRFLMSQENDLYSISHYEPSEHCDITVGAGNCNVIYHEDQLLSSINELFAPEDERIPEVEVGDYDNKIYLSLEGSAGDLEGSAKFRWENKKDSTYTSTWQRKTLKEGTDIILVAKPASLRVHTSDSDSPYVLFAKHEGFLRRGSHIPAGNLSFESDIWFFNDAAMKDILKSLEIFDGNPFFSK